MLNMKQPKVRILHSLSRSGATLVCRCIGCMSNIILLSEIHPLSSRRASDKGQQSFDPLIQACYWHNILSPEDISVKQYNYIERIQLIVRGCNNNFKQLVIRDFTQIDFIGIPSRLEPSYYLRHAKLLSDYFDVIPFALVRHPIDMWLSQRTLPHYQSLAIDIFLDGYFEYAQQIQPIGFIRYEDFIEDPEKQMQIICYKLQIQFDRNFLTHWTSYDKITGDTDQAKSRGAGLNKITSHPRRPIQDDTLNQFRANKKYWEALKLLNYHDI
jgi:protein O-GlcNAc transferase